MQSLEHEVIEKFRLLDKAAQERVRELIERELVVTTAQADSPPFDFDAWTREVENLRQEIRAEGGLLSSTEAVSLLRDIRDGVDE